MNNLIAKIESFRNIYREHYIEKMQNSIPQLTFEKPIFELKNQATEEEITFFENTINQKIPDELITFYKKLGQLINENEPENLTISIPSLADLLLKKGINKWTKTPSFGLIDMMKLHWGNDRYELNDEEFFRKEQIQKLNANYICIGFWCSTVFYEESYFIVFDKNHNFIEIKYNQNDFNSLKITLLELLEKNIPNQSLEELLDSIFQKLKNLTIEFGKNW